MAQMMSRAHAFSALVLLVACGDDGGSAQPDAGSVDARVFDAPSDCDYTEQNDLTNDTTEMGTSETTGVTFSSRAVICGTLNHTNFQDIYVDVDSFTLTVAAETDVVVRLLAPNAGSLEFVALDVYDSTSATSPRGILTYYGNHGVVSAHLAAGTFELLPYALHSEAPVSSLPYRIEVTADTPDTRCPVIMSGGYTEMGDGAQNNGNDVYDFTNTGPMFTASTTDAPEATSIVMAPDFSNRFIGEAANISQPDKYEDTDTYEIATGNTNELTVNLTWPAGSDLDWILYERNTTVAVARGNFTNTSGREEKLVAVKPNSEYWLVVAGLPGNTAMYNATLCGAQFTP